jgi:hypothetical protein
MSAVERHAVAGLKPLHAPGQIGFLDLDDQVIMVVHQDISMHQPLKHRYRFGDQRQPASAIPIIPKDRSPLHTASGHMIPGPGLFQP